MARKSERLSSSGMQERSAPAHKRVASTTATPSAEAKRSKTKKATPTKSQYFDPAGEDDEVEDEDSTSGDDDASDFNEDAPEASSGEVEDHEDDDDFETDEEPKSRRKSTTRKSGSSVKVVNMTRNEPWRTGKTGLGPGKQLVIKKPKARAAGKTPYSDDTLHPNTLLFLSDLKENNDRQWLKGNDAEFRQAERDWHTFVEKLTERLIEIDDTVPELPVKDIVFRIYRDVRFSPDQTPYKPYFSAAWSRTGRKGPYAHYYVQVAPNESFVGGGLWHPDAAPTAAMREAIDRHPERLKGVLMDDAMRKAFFDGAPKKESKVVAAFVGTNAENALKTKPKGYDKDHADIDLLRLRNYTVGRKLTADELLGTGGLDRIAELLSCMKPFITYINSVVMPDEEASSENEEGEDSDSEEESEEDAVE